MGSKSHLGNDDKKTSRVHEQISPSRQHDSRPKNQSLPNRPLGRRMVVLAHEPKQKLHAPQSFQKELKSTNHALHENLFPRGDRGYKKELESARRVDDYVVLR